MNEQTMNKSERIDIFKAILREVHSKINTFRRNIGSQIALLTNCSFMRFSWAQSSIFSYC